MTKLPLTALLAVAVLGVAPAAASAAEAKFTATYEGTLKTTWNTPRHQSGTATCFDVPYRQASGSETWSVKSRGRGGKVMVTKRGGSVLWHTGTHDLTQEGDDILAGGLVERSLIESSGSTPGKCGGEAKVDPPRLNDCGSLLPSYALQFNAGPKGGLVVLPVQPDTARNEKRTFFNCSLPQVDELTPGAWPDHPAKVSLKRIFGRGRTVPITGSKTWRGVLNAGRANATTTETKLSFKVKLTRVR
jgi:hypothetical protein